MALVSISFPKGQKSIKKSGEQALNHFFSLYQKWAQLRRSGMQIVSITHLEEKPLWMTVGISVLTMEFV